MVNDKEYWDNFYKEHRENKVPSSFAEAISSLSLYRLNGKRLLELGCGNGRDAFFFSSKGSSVTAIDLSSEEIGYLEKLYANQVNFVCGDFTQLSSYRNFDCVYSRFTFHSIDEASEDKVLSQLPDVLIAGGLFFLEARSEKDEALDKVFGKGHYRRYLNFEKTVEKIEKQGFRIIEKNESQGLAKYKEEDPFVLRIIAERL